MKEFSKRCSSVVKIAYSMYEAFIFCSITDFVTDLQIIYKFCYDKSLYTFIFMKNSLTNGRYDLCLDLEFHWLSVLVRCVTRSTGGRS